MLMRITMPELRNGTHDLGLITERQHAFLKPDRSLEITAGMVCRDVGGARALGVMDQHRDQALGNSAGQRIERCPEPVHGHRFGPLLKRQRVRIECRGLPRAPVVLRYRERQSASNLAIIKATVVDRALALLTGRWVDIGITSSRWADWSMPALMLGSAAVLGSSMDRLVRGARDGD